LGDWTCPWGVLLKLVHKSYCKKLTGSFKGWILNITPLRSYNRDFRVICNSEWFGWFVLPWDQNQNTLWYFYLLQQVISRVEWSWFDCTINLHANYGCIEPQFLVLDNFFLWCEQNKFYAPQKVISRVEWSWFDNTLNSHTNSECIEPQFLVLDNFLFYGVFPIFFITL